MEEKRRNPNMWNVLTSFISKVLACVYLGSLIIVYSLPLINQKLINPLTWKENSRLLVLTPTCKEIWSYHSHPYEKKNLNNLNINYFSWTHERIKFTGQTASLKCGEAGEYRKWHPRSAYQQQKLLQQKTGKKT